MTFEDSLQGATGAQADDAYLHPAFCINEEKLEPLLAEAAKIEELISTDSYIPGLLVWCPYYTSSLSALLCRYFCQSACT